MRLNGIRARFKRKRESGRHRGEPKHHYGLPLVFLGTVGVLFATIVTAYIYWDNPEPVASSQYHPSYNPTPPPHVFPPQQPSPAASTYTVVAGDTMWSVAYKKCGDGEKWKAIQALNSNDPWVIMPGQVLKLPAPACA